MRAQHVMDFPLPISLLLFVDFACSMSMASVLLFVQQAGLVCNICTTPEVSGLMTHR